MYGLNRESRIFDKILYEVDSRNQKAAIFKTKVAGKVEF
jgi:hypothetical protein